MKHEALANHFPLPFEVGQTLTTRIDRLAYGGDGVAHPNGFTLFVPRTAPGDEVQIEVRDIRRRYGRAVVKEVVSPSQDRIDPRCQYFSECGGCHLQHISSVAAAEQKRLFVSEALTRLGPPEVPIVEPLQSPTELWGYRNRVTYRRTTGAQGYVSWKSDEVLDIGSCSIARPTLNERWERVRKEFQAIEPSELLYVVLRETSSGEIAMILSTTHPLTDETTMLWQKRSESFASDTHVFLTSVKQDSYTPFGKELKCLHGKETLHESINGLTYHVRPELFFQVNHEMTSKVVSESVVWAKKIKSKRILDLYCGAGLFTLALAKEGMNVVGVEVEHKSIEEAKRSTEENGLNGFAQFRTGKGERILRRFLAEGERFDSAIVDPPRKGLHPEVIELLPKLGIKHLLYVSCSPPTFARDAKALAPLGFKLRSVQPYDMFPQTYHVELLGHFEWV